MNKNKVFYHSSERGYTSMRGAASAKEKTIGAFAFCCMVVCFCTTIQAMNPATPVDDFPPYHDFAQPTDYYARPGGVPPAAPNVDDPHTIFNENIAFDEQTNQPIVNAALVRYGWQVEHDARERRQHERDIVRHTQALEDPANHGIRDLYEGWIEEDNDRIRELDEAARDRETQREEHIAQERDRLMQQLETRQQLLMPYLTQRIAKTTKTIDSNMSKSFWYSVVVTTAEVLDYAVKYYRIIRMQKSTDQKELKLLGYISAATGAVVVGAKTSLGGFQGLTRSLPNIFDLAYGLRFAKHSQNLAKFNGMRQTNKTLNYLLLALQTIETATSLGWGRAKSFYDINSNNTEIQAEFAKIKNHTTGLKFFAPRHCGSHIENSMCNFENTIRATPSSFLAFCTWVVRYIAENLALSHLVKHPHATILNTPDLESYEKETTAIKSKTTRVLPCTTEES